MREAREDEKEEGGRAQTGGHSVRRVLKKPRRKWRERQRMRGEDEQCGVAGKEVSKPAEIG